MVLLVVRGLRSLSGLKAPPEVPEKSEAKLTGVVTEDAGEDLVTLRRISSVAVVVLGVVVELGAFEGAAVLAVFSAGFLFLAGEEAELLGSVVGLKVVAVSGS